MRLLITTDTVGGVWTFTKELSQGLLDYGFSVALVSLGRVPDAGQQAWADRTTASSWERFEYHATSSPLEWMQDNAESFTHSAALLERLTETWKPDLIHASQFCFGVLATDVPVMITAHSDVLSWALACNPEALVESAWLARYKALVQHGLYAAAAVAAPTRWMLDALAANFKIPSQSCTIGNGRTLEQPDAAGPAETWVSADPTRMNLELEVKTGVSGRRQPEPVPAAFMLSGDRKLQAVTAGRLWDLAKNLRLLLEVSSPIPLTIAGEAPPDCSPANVRFTGHLSEELVLSLFRESAIYICPSIYEPFGLAPLEAALCGCAVLANDIPSLRQVWSDAALYFRDAPSLERLLNRLASDSAQLAAAQQRSQTRAEAFSRGRMTAGYVRCYREILKKRQEQAHAA